MLDCHRSGVIALDRCKKKEQMDYLKYIFDFAITASPTILIVCGVVWAVARKYFEKRMELLATKADLREQTRVIERAKVEQSAALWLCQERWREQKESAFKIVEWLTNLHSSVSNLRTTVKAYVALLGEIDDLRSQEVETREAAAAKMRGVATIEGKSTGLNETLAQDMARLLGQLDLQPVHIARLLITKPELNQDLVKVFEHARNLTLRAKGLKSPEEGQEALGALADCADEFMNAAKTVAAGYRDALGFDDQPLDTKVEQFLRRT